MEKLQPQPAAPHPDADELETPKSFSAFIDDDDDDDWDDDDDDDD